MTDKSKDTGTGGINIDGKVHTMDAGVPDAQVDNTKDYSSGDIAVDHTMKDISKKTRETFAKYLSKATLGEVGSSTHENVYPVGSGGGTQSVETSLKDVSGRPVSPGPQNNDSKFDNGFNLTIASNNPAGIRRGLTPGSGPDGNTLLPEASSTAPSGGDYIKFVTSSGATGLKNPIKKYTNDLVLPNLFDFNSSLVLIPEYENSGVPSGIRSISKTASFADDGGTSKNILGGGRTLPLVGAVKLVNDKTAINKYSVDNPLVSNSVNFFVPLASARLAHTGNSKFFKGINIGVPDSYVGVKVNSKGKLNIDSLPDGHTLLQNATIGNSSGAGFIKFVRQDGATGLLGNLKTYTSSVVGLNLFDFGDTLVSLSDGTLGQVPGGIRNIKIMPVASTPVTDGGTSKNILGVDSTGDYTLTAAETKSLAGLETQNNRFPIDNPAVEVTLRDESGNPISVTAAQNVVTNTSFFTKLVEDAEGDKTVQVISVRDLSSYTDAFISSQTADSKFLIKRGKTPADEEAVDGNELLLNIAPEKDGLASLTSPAQAYTDAVLEPNLRDYSGYTSDKKSANLSGDAQSENLYDLHVPTDLATDGGESKNILNPDKFVSFSSLASMISTITTNNFFPIDSPVVGGELNVIKLDSSAVLSPTSNTNFFKNIDVGVSSALVTVNSKGKLKNIGVNETGVYKDKQLPDGNVLLSNAASGTPSGFSFIKFIKSADGTGLADNLKAYVDATVKLNLFNFDSGVVGLSDGGLGQVPSGIRDIKVLPPESSPVTEGGSSKNILNVDSTGKYTLTLDDGQSLAGSETTNNFFPIESSTTLVDFFNSKDPNKNPNSVTAAQSTFSNVNFFTNGGTKDKPKNTLESSYSNVFVEASSNPLSRFSIKRGKVATVGETGNELLSKAAELQPGGGSYVKFTKLNDNIHNYTSVQLKKNLYSTTNKIDIDNAEDLDFFGPKELHKPASGPTDAGTFDNIQSDPTKRAITREILFKHAKDVIAGNTTPGNIGNVYKIDDSQPKELFSFTTKIGTPASPTAIQNTVVSPNQYVFPVGALEGLVDKKSVMLQSSYSNKITKLTLRRGKSIFDPKVPDGNTLLKDAAAPVIGQAQFIKATRDVKTSLSDYIDRTLRDNRYNEFDLNQFVPDGTPGAEEKKFENLSDSVASSDRPRSFVHLTKLYAPGSLSLGESPQSMANRGAPVNGFTFRRLTRIGTILQLRAAGEFTFIGDDSADPRREGQKLAALIPGLGQFGAGVPLSTGLLNVKDIILNLPNDDNDISGGADDANFAAKYEGELIDISRNFEGIVNTSLEKFSGFTAIGMTVLAIALVAVAILAIQGIAIIVEDASDKDSPHGQPAADNNNIAPLGAFQKTPKTSTNIVDMITQMMFDKSALYQAFGIKNTYNRDYSDAVFRGALAFFGLGQDPPNLLSFSGQVIITSRAIVRGVAQLVLALMDIGYAFASGNITDAIFLLLGLFDVVRNNKFIKALNTFSSLGDRGPNTVLSDTKYKHIVDPEATEFDRKLTGKLDVTSSLFGTEKEKYQVSSNKNDVGIKISQIDSVDNEFLRHNSLIPTALTPGSPKIFNSGYVGISQIKNRLVGATRALAWSSYMSPSLLINPTANLNEDPIVDGVSSVDDDRPKNLNYLEQIKNQQSLTNKGPRLSQEEVEQYEAMMDGEYMPFYFHDLRTNEMIGFHAFLLSLSDDYSASYESVTGLGRAEPIRSYKETQRKIGLSFMLPALDKDDFDHMWDKINKLTMLVYPQYSAGKLYSDPNTGVSFEKPFTQQAIGSPMVRLRFGNLFRSNYSKYNLKKLFGVENGNTKLNVSGKLKFDAKKRAAAAALNQAKLNAKAALEKDNSLKDFYYVADYVYDMNIGSKSVYYTKLELKGSKTKDGIFQEAIPKPPGRGKPNAPEAHDKMGNTSNQYYIIMPDDKEVIKFVCSEVVKNDDGSKITHLKGSFKHYKDGVAEPNDKIDSPSETLFFIPVSDLKISETGGSSKNAADAINAEIAKNSEVVTAKKEYDALVKPGQDEQLTEFFNADKNAIVKSFESTKGRGLAGFIDSLNFDWYSSTTWDIDPEKKAPKMCKVTISFTPVHDIAPGLDQYGRNRAAIYPVGPYNFGNRKE